MPPSQTRAKLVALAGGDEDADAIAERVGQTIGLAGGEESSPRRCAGPFGRCSSGSPSSGPSSSCIDDLQWAEPTFLELVEYIADLARDAPILLACMARPELLDDHPGWAGGKLNATSILLEPLNAEECGTARREPVGG